MRALSLSDMSICLFYSFRMGIILDCTFSFQSFAVNKLTRHALKLACPETFAPRLVYSSITSRRPSTLSETLSLTCHSKFFDTLQSRSYLESSLYGVVVIPKSPLMPLCAGVEEVAGAGSSARAVEVPLFEDYVYRSFTRKTT